MKLRTAFALVIVASAPLVHTMVTPEPAPEPAPIESPACEDGFSLAEDLTCVPDNYWDTPETPDIGEPEYPTYLLPPCETEDSNDCYWDAAVRGNGEGTSFVTLNGVTYYPG